MKSGVKFFGIFLLTLVVLSSLIFAAVATQDEATKVNNAYQCLEDKVNATTCTYLTDEQKFFTLLTIGECEDETKAAAADNLTCWPKPSTNCKVKPTAQGILAMDASGEDTTNAEEWLMNHNATAKDLVWLLQVESSEAVSCTVKTDASTDTVTIGVDKKVTSISGGNCFSAFGQGEGYGGNYWLRVKDACYNKQIEISCDKNFLTTMLYKKDSSINTPIYVSDAPSSANGGEKTYEEVESYCFSTTGVCDVAEYESTLWAATVLKKQGYDVSAYMPYLITMAEDYEDYVPYSFLYYITHDTEYMSALWDLQNGQGYWDGVNSKFYSTAAALLPFGGQELQQKTKAKDWLLASQDASGNNLGCWNSGNIRDTGFILYSVWGTFEYNGNGEQCDTNADCAEGQKCSNGICVPNGGDECTDDLGCGIGETCDEGVCISGKQDCTDQGYFCLNYDTTCLDAGGQVKDNFECSGLGVCCTQNEVLQTCAVQGGKICTASQSCGGSSVLSVEGSCCIGNCVDIVDNSCSSNGGQCLTECDSGNGQTEVSGECSSVLDVCCKTTTSGKGFPWGWIILLIVLIALVALAIVFKDKLKELWIRMRRKKGGPSGPGMAPRGLPPRPMPPRGMPPQRRPEVNQTLQKLREMGGR